MYWRLIATFFFLITTAQAQIATPEMLPRAVNINPAVAAFRDFKAFGSEFSQDSRKTDITIDRNAGKTDLEYRNIKTSVQKSVFTYGGKKGFFVPEIYLAPQYGQKVTTIRDTFSPSVNTSKTRQQLFNNQVNLSLRLTENFSIGFKKMYTKTSYDESLTYDRGDGGKQINIFETKATYDGTGVGSVFRLGSIYLGYEIFNLDLNEATTYNYSWIYDGNESSGKGRDEKDSRSIKQSAAIGLFLGDYKHTALRLEASYERTPTLKYEVGMVSPFDRGIRRKVSSELTFKKIYLAANAALITGTFLDMQQLLEFLIDKEAFTAEKTNEYGFGLGLKSTTGHTFGGSIMYSKEEVKRAINFYDFVVRHPATTRRFNFSLNYTFVY